MNDSLHLRRATMEDAEIILRWVNDPMDRANSFNSQIISQEEHIAWMKSALNDPSRILYIMEDNQIPIGHIKLYISGDKAEVGYCIAPEYRGHGYANTMLKLLINSIRSEKLNIKTIKASVKPENKASIHALLNNGYVEKLRVYEIDI